MCSLPAVIATKERGIQTVTPTGVWPAVSGVMTSLFGRQSVSKWRGVLVHRPNFHTVWQTPVANLAHAHLPVSMGEGVATVRPA